MRTLGQFIVERRKELGLSGREVVAEVRNSDGKPISIPFLVDLEHDRRKPSDEVLEQFAKVLKVDSDMLYFLAGRFPADLTAESIDSAGRACRRLESFPARSEAQEKAVKMIPDRTGRFRERPYYELSELEERSEQTITGLSSRTLRLRPSSGSHRGVHGADRARRCRPRPVSGSVRRASTSFRCHILSARQEAARPDTARTLGTKLAGQSPADHAGA